MQKKKLLKFIGSKQPLSGIIWNKEGSNFIIISTGAKNTEEVS